MSLQLRLNEHYTSIQGEGPHVGESTQFVRFSGCNMRCPGWPCDTPHAIMPALWKDDPKLDPDALADQIIAERYRTGAMRICLTGGEPLMQDNDTLRALISKLDRAELLIDIFSNGSFIYPEWLMRSPEVTIIMDWKLEGSGEAKTKLANRHINLRQLRTQDCVKFVVASPEDLAEAHGLWKEWYFVRATPYVGAAWSKIDDKTIVDYVLENRLPWVLNVQLHKHIWGEQRGV